MTVKKVPMRRCVGCGESRSRKELIRIIRTPEGSITIDATGRGNGRGAYICPNAGCLGRAQKSRGLERSLKEAVPPEIYETLEKEMSALGQ